MFINGDGRQRRPSRRAGRSVGALATFAMCAGALVATAAPSLVGGDTASAAPACTVLQTMTRGVDDAYDLGNGNEPSVRSSLHEQYWLDNISSGLPFKDYDDPDTDAWLAESFEGFDVPAGHEICGATLEFAARAVGAAPTNDSVGVHFVVDNAGTPERSSVGETWAENITSYETTPGSYAGIVDLGALLNATAPEPSTVLDVMQNRDFIDVWIQDDTEVDFLELTISTRPLITIEKTTNGSDTAEVPIGGAVTWTYTITNHSDQPAVVGSLVDDQEGEIELNDCETDGVIAPGGSIVCTLTGIATAEDYCNTATAAGVIEGFGEFEVSDRSCYIGVAGCNSAGPALVVGTEDDFVGAEPTSPSTQLQTFHTGAVAYRDFDERGSDAFLIHTFDGLTAPAGFEICDARLRLRVENDGSNDNLGLHLVDVNGNRIDDAVYSVPLAFSSGTHTGVPLGQSGIIDMQLSDLVGDTANDATTLIPQIDEHGFLDMWVQDDSAVDWVSIELFVQPVVPAGYHPLNPARILDSRKATQNGPYDTPWGEGETRPVRVTDIGGVPATGVTAVAVNITTVTPSAPGSWLTISPTGSAPSTTAAMNFGTDATLNQVVTDLVIAKVGDEGHIDITNANGTVHLVIEVVGYYSEDGGSNFVSVDPVRLLDSRSRPAAPWMAQETRAVQVAGQVGVPNDAVGVALSVTTVNATAQYSWLTMTPTGSPAAQTASVFFGTHPSTRRTTTDLVFVKLGDDGKINIFNQAGTTDLVIEVVGYFSDGAGKGYVAQPAARILDSRDAANPWKDDETRAVKIDVNPACDGVALNITSVKPTALFSWLAVSPGTPTLTAVHTFGTSSDTAEVVNDLVMVKAANGFVNIKNENDTVHLVIDKVGSFGC